MHSMRNLYNCECLYWRPWAPWTTASNIYFTALKILFERKIIWVLCARLYSSIGFSGNVYSNGRKNKKKKTKARREICYMAFKRFPYFFSAFFFSSILQIHLISIAFLRSCAVISEHYFHFLTVRHLLVEYLCFFLRSVSSRCQHPTHWKSSNIRILFAHIFFFCLSLFRGAIDCIDYIVWFDGSMRR